MKKISKKDIPALLAAIAGTKDLYAPVKCAGQVNFRTYSEGNEVDIDTLKTVNSPKGAFFPQQEDMYTVIREGKKIAISPEELADHDFVLFGVKACDIQAFSVLDKVFLAEPVDNFYAARRAHGIVVGLACSEPSRTCFCKTFGVDAAAPCGDVATWILGEELYWEAKNQKGEALTKELEESCPDIFLQADDAQAVEEEKKSITAKVEALPYGELSLEGWGNDALYDRFGSPLWSELYKPCLACGTCTFVCPTCQCYDIKDYDTGHGIKRYRCWDSCMYSDFTLMAAVNNRKSQMERFRQRFMHKLAYFPANNDGMYSCVGCGRCVEKCPQNLNMIKVIRAFGKEDR